MSATPSSSVVVGCAPPGADVYRSVARDEGGEFILAVWGKAGPVDAGISMSVDESQRWSAQAGKLKVRRATTTTSLVFVAYVSTSTPVVKRELIP
jgi:hypothetical protein